MQWRLDGTRHETQDEDDQREENAEPAIGIERRGIVDRRHAEEAQPEQNGGPDEPASPEKNAERKEHERQEKRDPAMSPRANGANNVATIQLADREQVERGGKQTHPSGAADGMKKQVSGMRVGLEDGGHQLEDQRHAKCYVGVRVEVQRRNDPRVKHTVGKRGQSKGKADKRTGSADIEERAGGADGGTNQDESAECSD